MASIPPLRIPCPACGHVIEIPVTGIFDGIMDDAVQVTVEIDRDPIHEHAAARTQTEA